MRVSEHDRSLPGWILFCCVPAFKSTSEQHCRDYQSYLLLWCCLCGCPTTSSITRPVLCVVVLLGTLTFPLCLTMFPGLRCGSASPHGARRHRGASGRGTKDGLCRGGGFSCGRTRFIFVLTGTSVLVTRSAGVGTNRLFTWPP